VVSIPLNRGGFIRFFPAFLPPGSDEKNELQETMQKCRLYRQCVRDDRA
jgi:hypothetical protein